MNAKSKARILAITGLIFPALLAAFPADSLLLVQVSSLSAANDTFWVQKYAYSRDDAGFWHENMSEYRDDTLSSERFKTYDAGGHAVAESSFTRGPAGPVRISVRAEYDGQGRVSGQKRYLRDSVRETTRYGYDGNGRQASVISFGSDGDTSVVTTLEYDASGRPTRKLSRYPGDSTGFLFTDDRTAYDAAGNVETVKGYGSGGSLQRVDNYAYRSISVPLAVIASRDRRGPKAPGWLTSGSVWDILGRSRPDRIAVSGNFRR